MKTIKLLKVLFTLLAITIIGTVAFQLFNNSKTANVPAPEITTDKQIPYTSKSIGISFTAPSTSKITESVNSITISIRDEEIIITRSASYYDGVKEHVAYLEELNNYTFDKKVKVNESILMAQLSDKKIYFQKKGDYIFSVSTESTDLYDELENVAYSLK